MGIVVIGDVGHSGSYHLGDEAMTEYALDALRLRGTDDITIMTRHPPVAAQRFGTAVVPLLGFTGKALDRLTERLEAVGRVLDGRPSALPDSHPVHEVIAAVRNSSAVLIAGGGNITSLFPYHIYERVALGRIARRFGVPLVMTSQTLGPAFKPRDKDFVQELLQGASFVGVRDEASHRLALQHGADPDTTTLGMDDAAWLRPRDDDRARIGQLGLSGKPFMIGSFTHHAGSSGLSSQDYCQRVAATLDTIAERLGVDVLLVPHVGSFDPDQAADDQVANRAIAAASRSGRVQAMPMLTARQVIALTEQATLNLSTRYHPTVFGPVLGVPSISLALSYYSIVRMRGALRNVGLEDCVIPRQAWRPELVGDAAEELVTGRSSFEEHVKRVIERRVAERDALWDALAKFCDDGPPWPGAPSLSPVPPLEPAGAWAYEVRHVRDLSESLARANAVNAWEREHLRDRIAVLEEELAQLRRPLALRLAEALRRRWRSLVRRVKAARRSVPSARM